MGSTSKQTGSGPLDSDSINFYQDSENKDYTSVYGGDKIRLISSTSLGADVKNLTPEKIPSLIDDLNPLGHQTKTTPCDLVDEMFNIGRHSLMTTSQRDKLITLLRQHKDAFAMNLNELTPYCGPEGAMKLILKPDHKKVWIKPRRLSAHDEAAMAEAMPKLLEAGIIVRNYGPELGWASPVIIVAKKAPDGSGLYTAARCCVNWAKLNDQLEDEPFRFDRTDDLHSRIIGSRFLTLLDCRSGFMSIPLDAESQPLTTFYWNRVGLGSEPYMYTRLGFGLKQGPGGFMRRIHRAIEQHGCHDYCCAYIDDILIHSDDFDTHLKHVEKVILMMKSIGIKLHPMKSYLACEVIEFLGNLCGFKGISPTESKCEIIKHLPTPTSVPALRTVLGYLGWYRKYCVNYSIIARPLHDLLKKGTAWKWTSECQQSYDTLKSALGNPDNMLHRPDPDLPWTLYTDFSEKGISGILTQTDKEGNEHLICCNSRSLSPGESRYPSHKGELLAVVWSVRTFRWYLQGIHFTIITDHKPLVHLMQSQELTGMFSKWFLVLSEFSFKIGYRPGSLNVNADALSRFPSSTTEDLTGVRINHEELYPDHRWSLVDTKPSSLTQDSGKRQPGNDDSLTTLLGVTSYGDDSKCSISSCFRWMQDLLSDQQTLDFFRSHYRQLRGLTTDIQQGPARTRSQDNERQSVFAIEAPNDFNCEPIYGDGDSSQSESRPDSCSFDQETADPFHNQREHIQLLASTWIRRAFYNGKESQPSAYPRLAFTDRLQLDQHGICPVSSIEARPLASSRVLSIKWTGITLLEPFGGLAAGAEAFLRLNVPILRYIYMDISKSAQLVAQRRMQQLTETYGQHLLPTSAWSKAFSTLPQDIYQVDSDALVRAGARDGTQWVIVAGWECKDLSPAGGGLGLSGRHSSTFYPLLQLLGALQQIQNTRPPLYILENTAMQEGNLKGRLNILEDFDKINASIGPCITLDAAQCGSYCHRLRNYWTNFAHSSDIQQVIRTIRRPSNISVNDILDPGRTAQICRSVHPQPWYPANKIGQILSCLPTLMSYKGSHSFRYNNDGVPGHGLVHDEKVPDSLCSLNIEERERALGYATGCTNAEGVTFDQRHIITGNCMDSFAMQSLLAITLGLHQRKGQLSLDKTTLRATVNEEGDRTSIMGNPFAIGCTSSWTAARPRQVFSQNTTFATTIESDEEALAPLSQEISEDPNIRESQMDNRDRQESSEEDGQAAPHSYTADIWKDPLCLSYLTNNGFSEEERNIYSFKQKQRVLKRAASYQMITDEAADKKTLYRLFPGGTSQSRKIVPPPDEREQLVKETHEQCGHFGRQRTYHLLTLTYWWPGIYEAVIKVIRNCQVCAQMHASFNSTEPQLRPLPIMGLFYRWHADMCGPFKETPRGNKFVLVCIEAFSKFAVMIPLPSKEASETHYAFLHHVLARFGAPAEVVTDGGTEFMGSFDRMLVDAFIDHRSTSANHPQANGLAERCVQTLKAGIKKLAASRRAGSYGTWDEEETAIPWDLDVPWIALGYNASPQFATGFAPCYMLHARHATVPPSVQDKFSNPLNYSDGDNMDRLTTILLERAKLAKQACIIAGDNLLIAQHRDTKRYAEVRSGVYLPKIRRFEVGDFVYTKRDASDIIPGLEMKARPEILRIIEIRPDGVLILQGKDFRTISANRINCTPCHLPIIDTDNGPPVYAFNPCFKCKQVDQQQLMATCTCCQKKYHIFCLQPPLKEIPSMPSWICSGCKRSRQTQGSGSATQTAAPVSAVQHTSNERTEQGDNQSMDEDDELPRFISPLSGLTEDQKEHLFNNLRGRSLLLQHVSHEGIRTPEIWKLDYRGQRYQPKCFTASRPGRPVQYLTLDEVETMLVPDNFEPPLPEDRDRTSRPEPVDGNEFEIDKIIAKQVKGNKVTYQVLWKGYPDNEPFDIVQAKDINQAALENYTREDQESRRRAAPILNEIIKKYPTNLSFNSTQPNSGLRDIPAQSQGRPTRAHQLPSHLQNDFVTSAMHSLEQEIKMDGISSDFYLNDASGVLEALETLMPSPNGWTKGHATRLTNQLQGGKNFLQPQGSYTPGQPQRIATTELEIRALLEVVDFTLLPSIVDTFSGTNTIKTIFKKEQNLQVLCNDVDDSMEAHYHLDGLQPSTYKKIKKEYGLDAVVISPTFTFLDLALPLAVLHAEQIVCCHVPGHYLTCAPLARFEWMRHLQNQNRMHILAGLPIGPSHRRCLWLIIFRSEAVKRLLLRPGSEQYIGFTFHRSSLLNQPQPLYQERRGELIEAKEQFIAHQCHCSPYNLIKASQPTRSDITGQIFSRFPSSDIYKERGNDGISEPGSIAIRGRIIALFAQINHGHHRNRTYGDDTADLRLQYFKTCLQQIGQSHPRPKSIAFPHYIGCGLAGGHWNSYRDALQEFAKETNIQIVTYQRC